MKVPEGLRRLEKQSQLLNKLSGTPAEHIDAIMGLPEDLKGARIVDLAAGTSDTVPYFLARGADPFAVDHNYSLPLKKIIELSYKYTKRTIGISPQARRQVEGEFQKTSESFSDCFKRHRDRFITGWLTDIPLADGFADITLSMNGILAIAKDIDLLKRMLEESLRITREGGYVFLAPYNSLLDDRIFGLLGDQADLEYGVVRSPQPEYQNYQTLVLLKQS